MRNRLLWFTAALLAMLLIPPLATWAQHPTEIAVRDTSTAP